MFAVKLQRNFLFRAYVFRWSHTHRFTHSLPAAGAAAVRLWYGQWRASWQTDRRAGPREQAAHCLNAMRDRCRAEELRGVAPVQRNSVVFVDNRCDVWCLFSVVQAALDRVRYCGREAAGFQLQAQPREDRLAPSPFTPQLLLGRMPTLFWIGSLDDSCSEVRREGSKPRGVTVCANEHVKKPIFPVVCRN